MEFENRLPLDNLRQMVQQVKHEIGKTIIGQDKFIDLCVCIYNKFFFHI